MERFQQSKTILDLVGDKAVAQEDKQRFFGFHKGSSSICALSDKKYKIGSEHSFEKVVREETKMSKILVSVWELPSVQTKEQKEVPSARGSQKDALESVNLSTVLF